MKMQVDVKVKDAIVVTQNCCTWKDLSLIHNWSLSGREQLDTTGAVGQGSAKVGLTPFGNHVLR